MGSGVQRTKCASAMGPRARSLSNGHFLGQDCCQSPLMLVLVQWLGGGRTGHRPRIGWVIDL